MNLNGNELTIFSKTLDSIVQIIIKVVEGL